MFFSTSLKFRHLNMIDITKGQNGPETKLAQDLNERVRYVAEAPNGAIYFSTDDGNIYRITK